MLNLFDFNLISIFHFISFDRILTTSLVFSSLLSLNTRAYFVNSINKYHVQQKQKKKRLNVFFIRIYSSWNEISKHGPDDPIDNCGLIMTDDDIAWILLQAVILLGIIRWSILCSTSMKTSQNLRTICLTPFGLCRSDNKHGISVVLGPNFIVFFSHRMQIGCASLLTQLRTMFVLTLYNLPEHRNFYASTMNTMNRPG